MWFVYTYRLRLGTVYFKRRRRRVFRGRGDDDARKTADNESDTTGTRTLAECNNGTATAGRLRLLVTTILRFRTMLLFVYNINDGEREGDCRSRSSSEPARNVLPRDTYRIRATDVPYYYYHYTIILTRQS